MTSPNDCSEHGDCSSHDENMLSDRFKFSGNLLQNSSSDTCSMDTIRARPRQMLASATTELNLTHSHSLSYT